MEVDSNMMSDWLSRFRFHQERLMRARPAAFYAALGSGIVLAVALGAYVQQRVRADAAERDWRSLNAQVRDAGASERRGNDPRADLPAFDNTRLVAALNGVAEEFKLSLDEVSFAMDENGAQPYLRYRATLTVSSSYPIIRRFLDQVRLKQPEVSLDSIACMRDDITTVELTCDLALSAFYRKDGRG